MIRQELGFQLGWIVGDARQDGGLRSPHGPVEDIGCGGVGENTAQEERERPEQELEMHGWMVEEGELGRRIRDFRRGRTVLIYACPVIDLDLIDSRQLQSKLMILFIILFQSMPYSPLT